MKRYTNPRQLSFDGEENSAEVLQFRFTFYGFSVRWGDVDHDLPGSSVTASHLTRRGERENVNVNVFMFIDEIFIITTRLYERYLQQSGINARKDHG